MLNESVAIHQFYRSSQTQKSKSQENRNIILSQGPDQLKNKAIPDTFGHHFILVKSDFNAECERGNTSVLQVSDPEV